MRLAKDDYRVAAAREDVNLLVLRDHEHVAVAPPRVDADHALPASYMASAVPVAVFADAVIAGPQFQVFTSRGELIRESVVRRSLGEAALRETSLLHAVNQASVADGTVAVLGTHRANNYFHWWVDSVARVWIVDQALGVRGIAWIGPSPRAPFHDQSLALLDIPVTQRPVEPNPCGFSHVVFTPGLAFGATQALSPIITQFAGYLQACLRPRQGNRRIYITRHSARSRRVVNEEAVTDALATVGFETVTLDMVPVAEQATLFAEARAIVSVHGAGLTNLLFARPGTTLIEIFPVGTLHSSCYRHLASLLSQPYAPLETTIPPEGASATLKDDVIVDVERLLRIVEHLDRDVQDYV